MTCRSASKKVQDLAALIEIARKLGPMTEEQRREQRASFAYGQIALTKEWSNKSQAELDALRQLCRREAGCTS